jgi:phosphatidylglycerophosphatase A
MENDTQPQSAPRRIDWRKVHDNVVGAVATGLFAGFVPLAPGTAGSLLGAVAWWFLMPVDFARQVLWLALLFGVGVYASGQAEKWWGHDHGRIVIDEALGMCVTLLLVPRNIWFYLAAFLLFRLCDIVKFYPIDRAQKLAAGWGVMADDLLAGIYAGTVLVCGQLVFSAPAPLAVLLRSMPHRFILYALVLSASLAFIFRRAYPYFSALGIGIIGALVYWHWFPFGLLRQLAVIALFTGLLWWGAGQVRRRWRIDLYAYGPDKLAGIWLLLWFIPRTGWAYAVAVALFTVALALAPWPTRLVRARWQSWSPLLDDLIAAAYASVVLQTVVLIAWYDEMVLIKFVVLKLLGAI